jgi:single-strand DNA-binding protein
MINEAQVFLAGYVATEPTCRTTNRGKPEAQMRVGYTPRRMDRETGEWVDERTSFVSVKCWGRLANNVAVCIRKGEPVVVMGRVQVREYAAKDGAKGQSVDVYASSIGYDLARGVARFSRLMPSSGETAADRLAAAATDRGPAAAAGGTAGGADVSYGADAADGDAAGGDAAGGDVAGGDAAGGADVVGGETAGGADVSYGADVADGTDVADGVDVVSGSEPAGASAPL